MSKGSQNNPKKIEKIPNKSKNNLKDPSNESSGPNLKGYKELNDFKMQRMLNTVAII
jgi:hypothetical protein